jgi:enoyl-[acyl-carrier protein] reductase I
MIGLDLTGKHAFVTGVADDGGFGWAIAKALQAAGAKVYLASHPRVTNIVAMLLRRPASAASRVLPHGAGGELAPAAIIPCDVQYDTAEDMPADLRSAKGYADCDASIQGALQKYREVSGGAPIDILIHSVAFSPEITKTHLETSRSAYLTALSISSYSLVALARAALPQMEGRAASVVGLSYLASERFVPGYGGGMATAKAALECDARAMSFFLGQHGHRVNIVSPGPFPSRAARSIGEIDTMVQHVQERSPIQKAITADDVADSVVFLCSPLAGAITAQTLYIDYGYHAMAP